MVRRKVLTTDMARRIVRKAGFRPSTTTEASGERISAIPILSVPGSIVPWPRYGNCAQEPYGSDLADLTQEQIQDLYSDAYSAQTGNQDALNAMRGRLLEFNSESSIVMNCVMPLLGYDYGGEVCTYTIAEDGRCKIEIDVAPPDSGFWEQYKSGDTRFPAKNNFLADNVDAKFLCDSITWYSGESAQGTGARHNAGPAYPQCPGPTPGELITHEQDGFVTENVEQHGFPPFSGFYVSGYFANFDEDLNYTSGIHAQMPRITLYTDELLDSALLPFYPLTLGISDRITMADPQSMENTSATNWGHIDVPNNQPSDHLIHDRWRVCADPVHEFSWTQDVFPCFVSGHEAGIADEDLSDTFTVRDYRVIKEGHAFTQTIDFAVQPSSPSERVLRYSQDFEVFDVVAVRVIRGSS